MYPTMGGVDMWVNRASFMELLKLSNCLSVQFSRSVMSNSLQPHEPQHTRPPCPSPTPGVHPNPCPLCHWCHATISSSGVPFSSCPQSLPASESFQMSQLYSSGGQSIGVSASTSEAREGSRVWGLSCTKACGIVVPPKGMKPMSPALEDGFLTTGPPRKSWWMVLLLFF